MNEKYFEVSRAFADEYRIAANGVDSLENTDPDKLEIP